MKQAAQSGKRKAIPDTTSNGRGVAEVRFYRSNEKPYGAFSNLFRRSMIFEGREYPTAEHAYQAGKPRKQQVKEWILSAPTPSLVAMAAHGLYSWDIVSNWAEIKYDRMRQVLRAKFQQHNDLRLLLLSTADARLVEAGRVDSAVNRIWGEVNGKGQNMLGVLLMELRLDLTQDTAHNVAVVASRTPKAAQRRRRMDRASQRSATGQAERKIHGIHIL